MLTARYLFFSLACLLFSDINSMYLVSCSIGNSHDQLSYFSCRARKDSVSICSITYN